MSDETIDEVVSNVSDSASVDAESETVDPRSEIERERDEYRDMLQRLQADYENFRKRVIREADSAAQRASGDLVMKLLPVLDALDLAQAHFVSSQSDEAAAISQSRSLLLETLAKDGLERLAEVGVAFDPQIHDAVAHVDNDGGDQIIEEVLRAGYRWKGNVVRPAMVRVKG